MLDPPPEKEVLSRNKIRIGLRSSREHLSNLLPQLRRHPLIAVQTEYPVMGRVRQGLIAEIAESLEHDLIDPVGKLARDRGSPVRAMRVDDD